MADFWQGHIPTFQRLARGQSDFLETRLLVETGARPVTLFLPCHAREMKGAAFAAMLSELRELSWLRRLVIGLDQASQEDVDQVNALLEGYAYETRILWLDGPEWQERIAALQPFHLPSTGKGRNFWLSLGWMLEQPDTQVIALHDCDITPYHRELLIRLVYPLARPEFKMRFSKGYYARFTDRLHGRLTRFLLQPLLQTLTDRFPFQETLKFIGGFRYPLAGEVAMDISLAKKMHISSGWGLETAMLGEVHRLLRPAEVCQVDLCERYDHRHQPLRPDDSGHPGLSASATQVALALLEIAGLSQLPPEMITSYRSHAMESHRRSALLAEMNNLVVDLDRGMQCIDFFCEILQQCTHGLDTPSRLPSWEQLILEKPVPCR